MTTNRQNTRVIVTVHSHVAKEQLNSNDNGKFLDISADVIGVQTQKSTKAMGKWSITLVPRRNYLNFIFPNDLVNIYIDPGDGERGFVRTMFGYVDRIDRQEQTDQNGATRTVYTVTGSDFQKAVDKTNIYFNAYMRQILDERFARTDQGAARGNFRNDAEGSALRNAGLTVFGTPADFIENFLLTLLGFGSQWQLPDSYKQANKAIDANRRQRVARVMARIPQNLREHFETLGVSLEPQSDKIRDIIETVQTETGKTDAEDKLAEADERILAARALKQSGTLLTLRSLLFQLDDAQPVNLLDLISFDFIEALAVDGFQANASVWSKQGSVSQFLYGNSNDMINELIFDLRPVSGGTFQVDGGLKKGEYSKLPDELGINTEGTAEFPAAVQAVKYVPAVVFREYPYSVVSNFTFADISIVPSGNDRLSQSFADKVFFGPVFAIDVGSPGRKIYEYPRPIAPNDCAFFEDNRPIKHIDAVTIRNTDVVSSQIGRSDEDLFNLFQLTPQGSANILEQFRSVLTNFSPVLNQISVARNGLRVWEGQTQFANYSPNDGCLRSNRGGSPDNPAVRRNLVRWQLLLDHWYQHNAEYLNGTIAMRGRPEIRVGYRLDWLDRNESYYVEGVTQQWQYPGPLQTTVNVTRGQRNDPFPVYIPPVFINGAGEQVTASSGNRSASGRLAKFFQVRDTNATTGSTQRKGPFAQAGNETDEFAHLDRSGIAISAPNETELELDALLEEIAQEPQGTQDFEDVLNDLIGVDNDPGVPEK